MKNLILKVFLFIAVFSLPMAMMAQNEDPTTTYTITASADENGTITPSGEVVVNEGGEQAFTIAAAEGFQIASVLVDGEEAMESLVENVYTFTNVTADHTIAATFESATATTYTITASAGENGTITPSGEVVVNEGGEQAFTIAAAEGFQIASVLVDGEEAMESLVENVYTFTNVTADHTIAVTFEAEEPAAYTITATVLGGHGSVDPDGSIEVAAGSDYDVTFIPDEGYAIDTVVVNGIVRYPVDGPGYITNNVYSITNISEDYVITVSYKDIRDYFNIHVEVETAGGSATPNDTSVVAGADVTIVFTPLPGYHISQLSIDGNVITNCETNEISFSNIQSDHNIRVSFFTNSIGEESTSGFCVFPNPSNGMFGIDFSNIEGGATYQLIDVRGSVVETRDINVINGETMYFSNSLEAGAYFVRIIAADKVYVEQIIVE